MTGLPLQWPDPQEAVEEEGVVAGVVVVVAAAVGLASLALRPRTLWPQTILRNSWLASSLEECRS